MKLFKLKDCYINIDSIRMVYAHHNGRHYISFNGMDKDEDTCIRKEDFNKLVSEFYNLEGDI